MNLHKIVECIILTWLHLASSSSHDRNQFQSDRHGFPGMHNEKSRNERKPVGSSLDDSDFSRVLTDNAYPLKENQFKHENSAKINCENSTSNTNNTSAHVLTSYIVKRPSALLIDNNNEVKRRIGTVKVNGGEWSGTMRRLLVVISSNATTTTENTKSGKTTKGLPETSTRSAAAATTTTTTAASVQDELKNEKMINNTGKFDEQLFYVVVH
ncbi:hypothetical protein RUM43_000719 [Polyplax serrata]|uniref:Uncharacterized protein n=1 Tax=Polyplax serrata TaxID=468196 RepID=A0AAN8SGH3_POLSC